MQRKLNYSIRCLLFGLLSIVAGILVFVVGYGIWPDTLSKDLIETISTLAIESIPIGAFSCGTFFSLIGIIQKSPKYGKWFSLLLNSVPLGVLVYIISE